jgi:hypothetical protein
MPKLATNWGRVACRYGYIGPTIACGVPLRFSSSLREDSEAMAVLARAMFDGPANLVAPRIAAEAPLQVPVLNSP